MATIESIKDKGEFIKKQTGVGTVTNEVVGQQFVDVSDVLDREIAALSKLGVLKTYDSFSAMEKAVSNPIGDDGEQILHGQLVAVLDTTTPNKNGLYSYYSIKDGGKDWKKRSDISIPTDTAKKGGYEGTLGDLNAAKAEKVVDGKSIVYGSIATAATEAQKDNLVNVGLMNEETSKLNWHIKNIEKSDFNIVGYWSVYGDTATTVTYIRTKLFKVKKGQKFKNKTDSTSIYAASAVFFDTNKKFISFNAATDELVEAPEDGYVGFSKRDIAKDKNVYVTQDFWATQTENNVVAEYIHNRNKEVRIESIDYTTNTFVSTAHGLTVNDRLAINFRTDLVDKSIATFIPINNMILQGLYVVNITESTFQLSLTSNGAALPLVNESNVDTSLFWFEVVKPTNLFIRNLDVFEGIMEITGVFNSAPQYVSIEYGDNGRAGSRGFGWVESGQESANASYYGWQRFPISYSVFGHFKMDFSLNAAQGILHTHKTASLARFTDVVGVMRVTIENQKVLTTVPDASIIKNLYLSDGLTMLNGTTIKIYKKW